jgi:hypothetical protein
MQFESQWPTVRAKAFKELLYVSLRADSPPRLGIFKLPLSDDKTWIASAILASIYRKSIMDWC